MLNQINDQMKTAMKEKNSFRLGVLRMLKSKILVVDARGDVPEAEIVKLIKKYAKSLKETLVQQKEYNRDEEAADTEKELAIVSEFLPPEMSDEELDGIIKAAVDAVGATSMQDMGKVMKEVMAQQSGIDGGRVKGILARLLA